MGVKHHFQQQYFSLIYLGSQFHWRRKSEGREKINASNHYHKHQIILRTPDQEGEFNSQYKRKIMSIHKNYHIIKANCQIFQFLSVRTID